MYLQHKQTAFNDHPRISCILLSTRHMCVCLDTNVGSSYIARKGYSCEGAGCLIKVKPVGEGGEACFIGLCVCVCVCVCV